MAAVESLPTLPFDRTATVFRRFPTLRLAVPVERLRVKRHLLTGGLEALPVTW